MIQRMHSDHSGIKRDIAEKDQEKLQVFWK